MSKEAIKSFEIIKEMYEYFVKKYRDLEPKLMICEKEDFDNIETALKEYELMRQTKIIVVDRKISDDDLEKLKNQRMFVGSLECEIKPLIDEETKNKLKALEILKEILHIKIHIDKEENVAILYVDIGKDFKTKEFTHLILGYIQDKEKYELLKEVLE